MPALPIKIFVGLGALGGSVSAVTVPMLTSKVERVEFKFTQGDNHPVYLLSCPVVEGKFAHPKLLEPELKIVCEQREGIKKYEDLRDTSGVATEHTTIFNCMWFQSKDAYHCYAGNNNVVFKQESGGLKVELQPKR
ncbi:hypothetical protein MHLP_01805 [Candidatus Mycoplasma haematolamae str. Purdue]|uniref:Uncharacterized protein n=1 Tax=Mycoplasma haematolamae (strain Purdue) TaxID=1212765 RepID=I7CFF8_MYCHA|nr:hypothetical protein [Candidatus Mycoplasma haematolamae]AFO51941.1 hypothetical protein MHLP_01805 [Candidatus Mycoplasma haematolamae str. Purdue]